jgi:hypothetical protein
LLYGLQLAVGLESIYTVDSDHRLPLKHIINARVVKLCRKLSLEPGAASVLANYSERDVLPRFPRRIPKEYPASMESNAEFMADYFLNITGKTHSSTGHKRFDDLNIHDNIDQGHVVFAEGAAPHLICLRALSILIHRQVLSNSRRSSWAALAQSYRDSVSYLLTMVNNQKPDVERNIGDLNDWITKTYLIHINQEVRHAAKEMSDLDPIAIRDLTPHWTNIYSQSEFEPNDEFICSVDAFQTSPYTGNIWEKEPRINGLRTLYRPTMSGWGGPQFATRSHCKAAALIDPYISNIKDWLVLGDGSGGVSARFCRRLPGRGLFNTLMPSMSQARGAIPSLPHALSYIPKKMRDKCVNAANQWSVNGDASQLSTWSGFESAINKYNLDINLIFSDIEFLESNKEQRTWFQLVEFLIRSRKLSSAPLYVIIKTYVETELDVCRSALIVLSPYFKTCLIKSVELTSVRSTELYLHFEDFDPEGSCTLKGIEQDQSVLSCLPYCATKEEEYRRVVFVSQYNTFGGIPLDLQPHGPSSLRKSLMGFLNRELTVINVINHITNLWSPKRDTNDRYAYCLYVLSMCCSEFIDIHYHNTEQPNLPAQSTLEGLVGIFLGTYEYLSIAERSLSIFEYIHTYYEYDIHISLHSKKFTNTVVDANGSSITRELYYKGWKMCAGVENVHRYPRGYIPMVKVLNRPDQLGRIGELILGFNRTLQEGVRVDMNIEIIFAKLRDIGKLLNVNLNPHMLASCTSVLCPLGLDKSFYNYVKKHVTTDIPLNLVPIDLDPIAVHPAAVMD